MNVGHENEEKMLIFNLYLNKFKLSKLRSQKNQLYPKCIYSVRNHPQKESEMSQSTSCVEPNGKIVPTNKINIMYSCNLSEEKERTESFDRFFFRRKSKERQSGFKQKSRCYSAETHKKMKNEKFNFNLDLKNKLMLASSKAKMESRKRVGTKIEEKIPKTAESKERK